MKKSVVLFVAIACIAYGKKKPEPEAVLVKTYEAPVEKVFGAMVQAPSGFGTVTMAAKDACLVKFTTTDGSEGSVDVLGGPLLGGRTLVITPIEWTLLCAELPKGRASVTVRVTRGIAGSMYVFPNFGGADKKIVRYLLSAIWNRMDAALISAAVK